MMQEMSIKVSFVTNVLSKEGTFFMNNAHHYAVVARIRKHDHRITRINDAEAIVFLTSYPMQHIREKRTESILVLNIFFSKCE